MERRKIPSCKLAIKSPAYVPTLTLALLRSAPSPISERRHRRYERRKFESGALTVIIIGLVPPPVCSIGEEIVPPPDTELRRCPWPPNTPAPLVYAEAQPKAKEQTLNSADAIHMADDGSVPSEVIPPVD